MSSPKCQIRGSEEEKIELIPLFKHLLFNFHYTGGVIAQTFYVGAQIMCWTFIIHYGMTLIGLSAAQAQNYNILAMSIFLCSRFICTFILKYLKPGLLLGILAIGGMLFTLGAIFIQGMPGLYCLIGVSACMSLMFPTIYGIALDGLSPNDAKLGSAGLIFAIVGGAFMPRLQGALIDGEGMTDRGTNTRIGSRFLLPARDLLRRDRSVWLPGPRDGKEREDHGLIGGLFLDLTMVRFIHDRIFGIRKFATFEKQCGIGFQLLICIRQARCLSHVFIQQSERLHLEETHRHPDQRRRLPWTERGDSRNWQGGDRQFRDVGGRFLRRLPRDRSGSRASCQQ